MRVIILSEGANKNTLDPIGSPKKSKITMKAGPPPPKDKQRAKGEDHLPKDSKGKHNDAHQVGLRTTTITKKTTPTTRTASRKAA